MQCSIVKRRMEMFYSDKTRVVARPFFPSSQARLVRISQRVMALSDAENDRVFGEVMYRFQDRHRDIQSIFLTHYETLLRKLPEGNLLLEQAAGLDLKRKLLLGSYFTSEYSIEAAAFFNPSIVAHPDQSGLAEGSTRIILSFRATGEGHVSSIVFRTGVIDRDQEFSFDPVSPFVETAEVEENPTYGKHCFVLKLDDMGFRNFVSETILSGLGERFTLEQLNEQIGRFGSKYPSHHRNETVESIQWIAHSNYQVHFRADGDLSECVIFPVSKNESNGLEDARFVRFVDEDGSVTYYATYTAYNGFAILPQILATKDFRTFNIVTLNGTARNKGMALFPRRINGEYMMISRQDGENMYLMTSENLHFWNAEAPLRQPKETWEFVKMGNCGSPIETPAGWLVLTHGVGPVRQYCIGAILLDLKDPARVIGHMKEPLLVPNEQERDGYVPNVVYSCGAMLHHEELILPYAMSDSVSGIATIALADLLKRLT